MLQPDYSGHMPEQSEQFIQSALDALSAHISILDENGTIINVNSAWCKFADENAFRGSQYGIGTNYLSLCDKAKGKDAKEAPLVAHGIRQVLQNQLEEFRLEYPCHAPREKRWFVMHVTRFKWHGHARLIVAHQNVTELKRVQLELVESRERIQTILDNVLNGIMTLDADGVIESVNPASAEIFTYDMQAMPGIPFDAMLVRDDMPDTLPNLLQGIDGKGELELTAIRSDGTTFPIAFSASSVRLDGRQMYTTIVQDITDRKQVDSERLEKERLRIQLEQERHLRDIKNRFISMMSHELRTPLSSIMLSSDMLKRYSDRIPQDEQALYIDNINSQVVLLSDLIRDVSTINQSESGGMSVMPETTDLVAFCRNLADEFRLTHHETHTIIFSSQHETVFARIDPRLMRQVFSNLISNALKYSPDGGEVIIYVSNGGRYARVRVADNGIGIPNEDKRYLFEPFHRASNVDNLPGSGLGMAIAKQAVELHDGLIQVESEVNVGTSVTVSLPLCLDEEDDEA